MHPEDRNRMVFANIPPTLSLIIRSDMIAYIILRADGVDHVIADRGWLVAPVASVFIPMKMTSHRSLSRQFNMASRMESYGRGRRVQITRSTYELIADCFECEALGLIDVKGAERTKVWQVVDRKPAARAVAPPDH